MLMRAPRTQNGWSLSYGGIALMWRGGCIIRPVLARSRRPTTGTEAREPALDDYFRGEIKRAQKGWHNVVSLAVKRNSVGLLHGPRLPDSYRQPRLPANLLQAQRDYFGGAYL